MNRGLEEQQQAKGVGGGGRGQGETCAYASAHHVRAPRARCGTSSFSATTISSEGISGLS